MRPGDVKPPPGTIVHLRPALKTSPWVCQQMLAAEVVRFEDPWAFVKPIKDNRVGEVTKVHMADVGLHPAKAKKSVDMAGSEAGELRIPKPLYAPAKPLDLPKGWGEPTLF